MLVLTRKYQEKIRIGNDIFITILRMKGKAVRLGIEAPANIPVIRGELTFEEGALLGSSVDTDLSRQAAVSTGGENPPVQGVKRDVGAAAAKWPLESPIPPTPRMSSGKQDGVSLQRIPRAKVGEIMPQVACGPLRAMLNQRPNIA